MAGTSGNGSVQSLDRAFELLECLAEAGTPLGLSQLSSATQLPLTTIHRIVRSLAASGYVRQEPSRRYTLGPGLIRLGEVAGRTLGSWALPYLAELVREIGETANLATLDGDAVIYVAQVPSVHSMRMFTEVGRRVMAHCTGVGKALLSQLSNAEASALVERAGMPAQTQHTLTRPADLLRELDAVRERGYAVDNAEQEEGVRCVAVAVPGAPARLAISVSGPSSRVTEDRVAHIAPILHRVAMQLVSDLSQPAEPAAK